MAPVTVAPESAADRLTLGEMCEQIAQALIEAHPNDPKRGRVDVYREVYLPSWSTIVRVKFTLQHAVRRPAERSQASPPAP